MLVVYFLKQDYRGPWGDRDIVISARAVVGVPFSFAFYGDSCTPPGPDGLGILRGGPDNEKKKKNETEQKLKAANSPIFLITWIPLVVENDGPKKSEDEARDRRGTTQEKDEENGKKKKKKKKSP